MYCIQNTTTKQFFNGCNFIQGKTNFLWSDWQMAIYEEIDDDDFHNLCAKLKQSEFKYNVRKITLEE